MIEARDLAMYYGSFPAVEGVSFSVSSGEIMGLLGPNGAGKTTVLKILATQIVPTRGEAIINGASIHREPEKVKASLGYLPENLPLYDHMETVEYLDFVAEGRGLRGYEKKKRLSWVGEICDLSAVWRKPIGELSKGYRQRVGLAQALIHDPPVLILDEPTTGLDPLQVVEMRKLIRELSREKAVIFSTHILQEVEALADHITIINLGKVVAQGSPEALMRKAFAYPVYRLVTLEPLEDKLKESSEVATVEEVSREGESHVYRLEIKTSPEDFFRDLCASGVKVLAFERLSLSLEEIFLKLVKEGRGHEGNAYHS